ncbi:hypothetical protein RFI_39006, partial [Reticulomyxa filosa]
SKYYFQLAKIVNDDKIVDEKTETKTNEINKYNSIFVNLKSRLLRIIKSSKNNPNAATILNVARVNMDHQNWDKKNISHSFFEGASLKEVVLSGVSLFRDFLNFINLTNASVNEVNFGEYSYLKGHEESVSSIQFSSDDTKLYLVQMTIRFHYDVSSGKQIQCSNSLLWYQNCIMFI